MTKECKNRCLLFSEEKLCNNCAKYLVGRIKKIMLIEGLDTASREEFAFAVLFYKFGAQDILRIARENGVVRGKDDVITIHH